MEIHKHLTGLNDEQVVESRAKYGLNILSPPERESLWKIFIENFKDPIIRILIVAVFLSAGIAFIYYFTEGSFEIFETLGIAVAILLATGISTWFVWDANKKFDILNQVNDETTVKVIRSDRISEIPKMDVVVGDIVIVEQGEEVPADGELLEAVSLQVNESSLTGEPLTEKSIRSEEFDLDATYPSDHLFRGSSITDGHGIMRVKSVGDQTELGKVARKSMEKSEESTPLNRQLNSLSKLIGVIGFSGAILTFSILFIKEIFFNPEIANPTLGEFGLICAVLISGVVMLSKVWVPVIYDAYELLGRSNKCPTIVTKGSWIRWILYGIGTLIILFGIGIIAGVKPWKAEAWVTLDTAKGLLSAFMAAVTLIVVTIPEGLPMSVTLSLAMSMRKMLRSHNLVRKMHACETMGAVTVICTDKTGTVTQNRMSIQETAFYGLPDQKLQSGEAFSEMLFEGIAINTTAFLDLSQPKPIPVGNPTEGALLLWLNGQNKDYMEVRENSVIVEQLTFSTELKYMATLVESRAVGKRVLYVKGAPEILFKLCNSVYTTKGVVTTEEFRHIFEEQSEGFQKQAMRTLGFAWQIIDDDKSHIHEGKLYNIDLTFIGVAAIADPVREDVPDAIRECFDAGIDIKMITGDTPVTAWEIARQIGLLNESEEREEQLITGAKFAQLSDEEALTIVPSLKIMARARPMDKQRLIKLLQKRGEVVAVTGDGINDAPALNHAHVGLSMGSGTSVAKEASDITLLDDSFSSIASAVLWGRTVYQNIQRFILFQLTINVVAMVIVLFGSIFGSEIPLTVTQMLWVNLIMDTFAAAALASLPPDRTIMKRKPRNSLAFIITPAMRRSIMGIGLSFAVILLSILFFLSRESAGGINSETESGLRNLTIFFTIFIMFQFWNMFNAKAFDSTNTAFKSIEKSRGFLLIAFLIIAGQIIVVNRGGEIFRTTPLSWSEWFYIITLTSMVFWIGEVVRAIQRKKDRA